MILLLNIVRIKARVCRGRLSRPQQFFPAGGTEVAGRQEEGDGKKEEEIQECFHFNNLRKVG